MQVAIMFSTRTPAVLAAFADTSPTASTCVLSRNLWISFACEQKSHSPTCVQSVTNALARVTGCSASYKCAVATHDSHAGQRNRLGLASRSIFCEYAMPTSFGNGLPSTNVSLHSLLMRFLHRPSLCSERTHRQLKPKKLKLAEQESFARSSSTG